MSVVLEMIYNLARLFTYHHWILVSHPDPIAQSPILRDCAIGAGRETNWIRIAYKTLLAFGGY